jgi:hypothetical protein
MPDESYPDNRITNAAGTYGGGATGVVVWLTYLDGSGNVLNFPVGGMQNAQAVHVDGNGNWNTTGTPVTAPLTDMCYLFSVRSGGQNISPSNVFSHSCCCGNPPDSIKRQTKRLLEMMKGLEEEAKKKGG